MFIAHLPAGYLATKACLRLAGAPAGSRRPRLFALGLLASILPDFDLLWFYFVDERQHVHHSYWPHLPVFWVLTAAIWFGLVAALRRRSWFLPSAVFFTGGLSHLLLDSVVGKIRWLYPWSLEWFHLFTVEPRYEWWVWNFVFHGTFIFEVLICALAAWVYVRGRTPRLQQQVSRAACRTAASLDGGGRARYAQVRTPQESRQEGPWPLYESAPPPGKTSL